MTYEEAIIDIRENIQPIIGGKSLNIAISAIEKQIPKKVKIVEGYVLCPICNHCIEDIDFISNNSHKYCDCCGQALDFGVIQNENL